MRGLSRGCEKCRKSLLGVWNAGMLLLECLVYVYGALSLADAGRPVAETSLITIIHVLTRSIVVQAQLPRQRFKRRTCVGRFDRKALMLILGCDNGHRP